MPPAVRRSSLYASAVAMNNVGVALLDRGSAKYALATLKEAIKVLQRLTSGSPFSDSYEYEVQHMLRVSYRRLAEPKQQHQESSEVVVISYDRGMTTSTPRLSELSELPTFAIKIEDISTYERHQVDIHSAILLQNLAVAHLCFLRTVTNAAYGPQVQQAAVEIATLSYNIIAGMGDNESTTEYVLGVAAMSCLLKNLQAAKRDNEAADVYRRLKSFLSGLEGEQASEWLIRTNTAAGAA